MSENLYELSDRLNMLRRQLADFEHGGVTFEGSAVGVLMSELRDCGRLAQRHEHEISRHRWNSEARRERAAEEKMLEELARPGTNVVHLNFVRHEQLGGAA